MSAVAVRSVRDLLAEAIAVQDACNLVGVVNGFARAIGDLRANLPNMDGDAVRAHPVSVLWASKIASLTLCEDRFAAAYATAMERTGYRCPDGCGPCVHGEVSCLCLEDHPD